MIRFSIALVFALASVHLHAAAQAATAGQYKLGIFPYMEPRQTVELFGPAATLMSKALDLPVQLESASTYSEFNQRMAKHRYDIALIQPMDYPLVVEKLGYIPVAKINVPLVTQLMVRDDSKLKHLPDIRGTTIGLPPEQSANARMILRALRDNQIAVGKDVNVRFFKSHDSCLQQAWIGEVSACGTSSSPIMLFEQRMNAKLRSIYDSEPIPRTLFVVHPRVSSDKLQKLKKQILSWGTTEESRQMLHKLGFKGFQPVLPGEYDVIHKYISGNTNKGAEKSFSGEFFLGVFPFLGTRQITANFSPIIPALRKAAGFPVYLRTAASFDVFDSAISEAKFDIILIQPFDFEHAAQSGYVPVAAMKGKLAGSFLVAQASTYKDIADFRGKTIAMPPINSVQAHLGRKALQDAGLVAGTDVTIDYRNSHEACLQQVHLGEAAACISGEIALSFLPRDIVSGLRKVGKTEKVPGVLFMVHKRVPASLRQKIHAAIISWKNDAQGKMILDSMGMGEFVDADVRAYRHLQEK